jgi:hypothetical protein
MKKELKADMEHYYEQTIDLLETFVGNGRKLTQGNVLFLTHPRLTAI